MKNFNTFYKNKSELKRFLKINQISDGENILVQVFTGRLETDYLDELFVSLKILLPSAKIIGTTTSGEMCNSLISETLSVLSFSIFQESSIEIHSIKKGTSSKETVTKLIEGFKNLADAKLAIAFVNGFRCIGEDFLEIFKDLAPNVMLSGGLAGDNAKFENCFVFDGGEYRDVAIVIALFYGENLIVNRVKSFGWKPIGKKFTITKSNKDRVYTIDDKSPLEIYSKYVGEHIAQKIPESSISFPLILIKDDKLVARNIIAKYPDGSFKFSGNFKEGEKVQLGFGSMDDIHASFSDCLKELKTYPIETLFTFSSTARRQSFEDTCEKEMRELGSIAPNSGFFSYGEFSYLSDKTDNCLLNATLNIVALSESSKVKNYPFYNNAFTNEKVNNTMTALTHLVNTTSQEINSINENLKKSISVEVAKNRLKDQQLLEQSRMAQMGEMIGMIAHQWRQPLSAISATANNLSLKLMMGDMENNFFSKELEHINEYSQHLSSTIDDFRNFFKNSSKMKESTSLKQIVKSTIKIIHASIITKEIDIKTEFIGEQVLSSYPNELKQVVLNLIKNAEDVLIDKHTVKPYIYIKTYLDENNNSILEVSDNAGGVKEDIITKIFDPYFSTKLKKDGTGLGLYMSKTIIEEHCNGHLTVKNIKNGAMFKISISLDDNQKDVK